MVNNYLVSRDWPLSRLWMVSKQRHDLSATAWEIDTTLGFHRTAKAARAALERRQGGKLTAWARTQGRGCATYRAQDYTGPVMDGAALAERAARLLEIQKIEALAECAARLLEIQKIEAQPA